MDIIELLSEVSENPVPPHKENDVIVLSDELDHSSQVQAEDAPVPSPQRHEYRQVSPSLPADCASDDVIIFDTQGTSTHAKTTPKRSILDLDNWISSSEDDSFLKNSSLGKEDSAKQVHSKPVREGLLKKLLLSSPISERISQSQSNSQSLLLGPIQQTEMPPVRPKRAAELTPNPSSAQAHNKRALVSSDPIESSPISSPQKKKPANKKQEREKSALDKEWREANKTTRRKNDLLKEMIIEISHCIRGKIQTEYFSKVFELPQVRLSYLDIPLISWKRRVKAIYNKEEDIFVPCELTEINEKPLMLFYEAEDLVLKIQDGSVVEDIQISRRKAFSEDPLIESYVVILVPGFKNYLRKLQALEDKQYRQNLLLQLDDSQTRKRHTETSDITASAASKLIVEAEVNLGVNIFMTKSMEETIDWLHSFTHTIGSSLYDKFERNSGHSNFGHVKLGSDRKSTFIEMVKKFNLMTAPKAQNLYQYYDSVSSLYDRYMKNDNLGTVNGKSIIPPTVNTSMMRVFTAEDCEMVITE